MYVRLWKVFRQVVYMYMYKLYVGGFKRTMYFYWMEVKSDTGNCYRTCQKYLYGHDSKKVMDGTMDGSKFWIKEFYLKVNNQ